MRRFVSRIAVINNEWSWYFFDSCTTIFPITGRNSNITVWVKIGGSIKCSSYITITFFVEKFTSRSHTTFFSQERKVNIYIIFLNFQDLKKNPHSVLMNFTKKNIASTTRFSCLFLDKLPQIDELNYHNCKYFLIQNVEDVFIFNDYCKTIQHPTYLLYSWRKLC